MQTEPKTIVFRVCPQCGMVQMPDTLRCPTDHCKLEPILDTPTEEGDEDGEEV